MESLLSQEYFRPREVWVLGSRARLEYVLERFDIKARAFLEAVSDLDKQNAFIVVLNSGAEVSCEEYTGVSPHLLGPVSVQAPVNEATIYAGVGRWTKAGYQRLAEAGMFSHNPKPEPIPYEIELPPGASADAGMDDVGNKVASERRKAVDNYIEEARVTSGKQLQEKISRKWRTTKPDRHLSVGKGTT